MNLSPAALVPESEPEPEPETRQELEILDHNGFTQYGQRIAEQFRENSTAGSTGHGHGQGHGLDPARLAPLEMKNPRKLV